MFLLLQPEIKLFWNLVLVLVTLQGLIRGHGAYLGEVGVTIGLNTSPEPDIRTAVQFLQNACIGKVRLYNTDQTWLRELGNTGIEVTVQVQNQDMERAARNEDLGKFYEDLGRNLSWCENWVLDNIKPYIASTNITTVLVGNEWLGTVGANESYLLMALKNIQNALRTADPVVCAQMIKVSTAHNVMNILDRKTWPTALSVSPSIATFEDKYRDILKDVVAFLMDSQNDADFMVNLVPYAAYTCTRPNLSSLSFATFQNVVPLHPPNPQTSSSSKIISYYNLFDVQVDAVYYALYNLSGNQNDAAPAVLVSECGWPHFKEVKQPFNNNNSINVVSPDQNRVKQYCEAVSIVPRCCAATPQNAKIFNQNLIRHVLLSPGTPARPYQPVSAYISSLFDESQKRGGDSTDRYYGFFNVYHLDFRPSLYR